jgi:hypothetical protein
MHSLSNPAQRDEALFTVIAALILPDNRELPFECMRHIEAQAALSDVACVFLRVEADFHTLSALLIVVTLIMASSKKFDPPAYGADIVWYAI